MDPIRRVYFLLIAITIGCSPRDNSQKENPKTWDDQFSITHIESDTLFDSNQNIYILSIANELLSHHAIGIGYDRVALEKTSTIAKKNNAIAAINGSFFDRDNGGSVAYLEADDSVISRTRSTDQKWAVPDSLINGAVILTKENNLQIELAKSDQYYEGSSEENFAIISGPLLLLESVPQKLPDMKFTHHRHPRSCLCRTDTSILLIAIDGRSEKSEGMSLPETQQYLKAIGCIDAINLDGGGSTTLWTQDQGIVNEPSDKEGERLVANAILVK